MVEKIKWNTKNSINRLLPALKRPTRRVRNTKYRLDEMKLNTWIVELNLNTEVVTLNINEPTSTIK